MTAELPARASFGQPLAAPGLASPVIRNAGWLAALVIIAAAAAAFSGLGSITPMETHEVFVARTAEEMLARNDWFVPTFNAEPRVKKPPLNYWLVMLIDRLSDHDGRISEFEARLPSAAAGVLLVALTILLGRIMLDQSLGLLGGLLIASCSGFAEYTHSARPEMVYAALCQGAMVALALAAAWEPDERTRSRCAPAAWSAWALLGLASLSKGPQLPIMIVAGWAIGLAALGWRKRILMAMRPWSGLIIFLVIALWWYALIVAKVPGAMSMIGGETLDRYSGSERFQTSWWTALDPYYVYRTAGLFMPWVILYVTALALRWFEPYRRSAGVVVLWWVMVAAMICLSFSFGRRWYYMLPVMGPIALLMAVGGVDLITRLWGQGRARIVAVVAAAHALGLAAATVWFAVKPPNVVPMSLVGVVAVVLAAVIVSILAVRWSASPEPSARRLIAAALLVGCVFLIAGSIRGSLTREKWREHRDFALEAARIVGDDGVVAAWIDPQPIAQYYMHCDIPIVEDAEELAPLLLRSDPAWLIVDFRNGKPALPGVPATEVVLRRDHDGRPDSLQLWRLTRSASAP